MSVELTNITGTIVLGDPVDGWCVSCAERRDVTPVHVVAGDLHVCGQCVTAALAIHMTARVAETSHQEAQSVVADIYKAAHRRGDY